MAKKPWDDKWEIVRQLPGGGQCFNFIVTKKGNDHELYVLKTIKDSTNLERRTRFYREVHNYIALEHPSLPKIMDHNCDESPTVEKKLFFVYPFIEGINLEEFIQKNGLLSLNNAVALVLKLCDWLNYCHEKGLVHRDIKPDNIILRDNNLEDPLLIDYGLSASDENPQMDESGKDQLGNRFIYLPELKYNSGNKRDKRSDMTYLAGVLFFALTGQNPAHLIDEEGRLPHQRIELTRLIPNIHQNQLALLQRIFDKGFQLQLNYRFQSIEDLKALLNKIIVVEADEKFNYEEFLKNSSQEVLLKVQDVLESMLPTFKTLIQLISHSIRQSYRNIEVGVQGPSVLPHWEPICIASHCHLTEKFKREVTETYLVKLYPNGNEYILSLLIKDEEHVIDRFTAIDQLDIQQASQQFEKFILNHFALKMSGQ